MTAWSDDPLHAIGGVVERVPALRLLEDLSSASRGEEISVVDAISQGLGANSST